MLTQRACTIFSNDLQNECYMETASQLYNSSPVDLFLSTSVNWVEGRKGLASPSGIHRMEGNILFLVLYNGLWNDRAIGIVEGWIKLERGFRRFQFFISGNDG